MATISFARGVPAPEPLLVEVLADCAPAPRSSATSDAAPLWAGRRATGRSASGSPRGTASQPAQVLVTNGSLQGLSLVAAPPRSTAARDVLVEAPTYDRTLHIAARHEAEPVPVPTDEEGLDPDALELPAAFLYTIPTFQNPSGRTLSLERRRRLAELARRRRAARPRGLPVLRSSASGASRCRASTSWPAARASSTRSPSRRSSRPACASATSSGQPSSSAASRSS